MPREHGGVIVIGRNVAWKLGDAGAILLELDAEWRLVGFNDLSTDPDGRVLVGAIDFDIAEPDRRPTPGYLHIIDLDGTTRIIDRGIDTDNGPDGYPTAFDE